MAVVDRWMQRPKRTESWGTINATVFVTPLPFSLEPLGAAAAVVEYGIHDPAEGREGNNWPV